MSTKSVVAFYGLTLVIIAALYVFTALFAAMSKTATPALEAAIPVFVDLLKVITGAAVGSLSTAFGKGNN